MITIEHPDPAATASRLPGAPTPGGRSALCVMPSAPASVPALRRFVRDLARRWGLSAADEALSLVVTELVTNVLLHSGSPDVTLLVTFDRTTLTVVVRDTGRWQPRAEKRRAAEDADARCGRGLPLVAAHTTRCAVFRSERGTRVVAELALPGAG
ncbi:ATP-binding protein [Kitasatospora sp. NPDC002227]|uniref:ATP-binding protein n=1 Tax=Kitasatospora sp. NPDC002227 TaxID=3154773 RepID=UPI00333208F1